MNRFVSRIRKPVKRQGAETYLMVTLLSFAASVAGTRIFLVLTGYPQLGGGGLHIAHVLWGGLLLYAAALLPLILANRWAYTTSAVLSGLGIGLFIDEVGKFITENNDYFYPPAAPIIYAFFLLTVLLYLRLRKPPPRQIRDELYNALDSLQEVLDHDLEPHERTELQERLAWIAQQQTHPDLARLAKALNDFLEHPETWIAPDLPDYLERLQNLLRQFERLVLTPTRLRAVLVGGLSGLGLVSLIRILQFAAGQRLPDIPIISQVGLYWFIARLGLEALISIMLVAAALALLLGRLQQGLGLSSVSLLLSLTMLNLLVFYFDQFSTIVPALIQFGLLIGVAYYRRNYLAHPENLALGDKT